MAHTKNPICIVIPAFNPDSRLSNVVSQLVDSYPLIIVDDGSDKKHSNVFQEFKKYPNVFILKHAINLGKGYALKTAFNYFLVNFPNSPGVVTADADGQHSVSDIINVAEKLLLAPQKLHLGTRLFDSNAPARSKIGNVLTRFIFKLFTGTSISDTQTGLRGIPNSLINNLLEIKANGYDFELEMLLHTCQGHIPIEEITIKTIYEDGNKSSHFNPVIDSVKIYFVFFRFFILSILTAIIDYTIFSISWIISSNILLSTIIARIFAGIFNFTFAKKAVFLSGNDMLPELMKYISLVTVLMFISYGFITFLILLFNINIFVAKIIVEGTLFFASFAMQRLYIFNMKEED